MTTRGPRSETKRVIGLFPGLLGAGGVQEAGRVTAAALQEIALRRGWSCEFLSFNDPRRTRSLETGAGAIGARGFARA